MIIYLSSLTWGCDYLIFKVHILSHLSCVVKNITALLKKKKKRKIIYISPDCGTQSPKHIHPDRQHIFLPATGFWYWSPVFSLQQVVWLQPSTGSVNLIMNGLPPFNSPAFFLHHSSLTHRSSPIAQLATLSWVLLVAFTCDFKDIELDGKQSGDLSHGRKIW